MALLAACGARTGLGTRDSGAPRDAAGIDAGPARDAGPGVDAGSTPSRCEVPSTSTVVTSDGAPGFVFSLATLPSSEPGGPSYVLAAAHGWPPDERATLHLLDDHLAASGTFGTGGDWGTARFDAVAGEISATFAGGDGSLALERYAVGAGGLARIASEVVCDRGCDPGWDGPAVEAEGRAVVAGELGGGASTMFIRPRAGGPPPTTVAGIDLRLAEVVALDGELVVVGNREDALGIAHVTWDGVVTSAPRTLMVPLVSARFGAVRRGARDVLVGAAVTGRGLVLLDLRDDAIVGDIVIDPDVAVPNNVAIAVAGDLAAVAWGEQFSRGRVGAHLAVVDLRDGTLFMPSTLVSGDSRDSASYTIWAAVAPHADGFAVVWGGWEPHSAYAVYGKVVRCAL